MFPFNSIRYATYDIYEDTVARTDARSDAYKFAEIMGGTPKCWGSTWGGILYLYLSLPLPLRLPLHHYLYLYLHLHLYPSTSTANR